MEEIKDNTVALAGYIIARKQKQPVREAVRQVFGRAGRTINSFVQETVNRVIPEPARKAIKTTTTTVINTVKNTAVAVKNTVVSGARAFVGWITGKR